MTFIVALLQIDPFGMDQTRNLEKGRTHCRTAKSMGANLAVFTRTLDIGALDVRSMRRDGSPGPLQPSTGKTFFSAFAALAEELSMNIAVTYLEAHLPKPRNSVSIINGKVRSC
jgi:predicted amidohydrolase